MAALKLISLALLVWLPVSQGRSAVLGDRIILDIGGNSFTQRQLEAHILVRESLQQRVDDKLFVAATWQRHLQSFLDDMLILAKIEQYNWYPASHQEISMALKTARNNLGAANSDLVRLGVDAKMLRSLVASNLKIKTYRSNQSGDWLVRLRKETYMRFYTGSSVFREIRPQ